MVVKRQTGCTCEGRKHVWSPTAKAMVPCVCLKRERQGVRYRKAGIPTRFEHETWRTFFDLWRPSEARTLADVARALKTPGKIEPTPMLLLTGRPSLGRELAGALLARSACDGGRTAMLTNLPALIDYEFGREDEGKGADPYRKGLLVVTVGSEPGHKWNRPTLEKVIRIRSDFELPTVLSVQGHEPHSLGSLYHSSVVEEAVRQFTRIEVTPR